MVGRRLRVLLRNKVRYLGQSPHRQANQERPENSSVHEHMLCHVPGATCLEHAYYVTIHSIREVPAILALATPCRFARHLGAMPRPANMGNLRD